MNHLILLTEKEFPQTSKYTIVADMYLDSSFTVSTKV